MKRVCCWLLLAIGLSSALSAYADCVYKGKSYPTGTRVNNLTCQADGTWK